MAELDSKYPGIPMVLMGDCNCVVGSEPYESLTESRLINSKDKAKVIVNGDVSTIHGVGSTPGFGTVIDHAFITKSGFDVTQYQTFANLNIINMSDHLPIGIDFALD